MSLCCCKALRPERVVDDAKLWNVLRDPVCFGIDPGHALSSRGILDVALLVPDEAADKDEPRLVRDSGLNRSQ